MKNLWILPAALLASLVACTLEKGACPDGYARDNDGNCVSLSDGSSSESDNSSDNSSNNGDDNGSDSASSADDGAGVGDACFSQDDCKSGLICIVENSSDDQGICTETCDSWSDCSEAFWECCDIDNGTTACIPDNWLSDTDQCN